MPHIAEGLMHAHLDGALGPDGQLEWAAAESHLDTCADCRARLAEARELRRKARTLLAEASPSVAAGPGFAALVAEAEKRGETAAGAGARWWRSTARLAWAASLVIAAGAGWIGHELLMQQGPQAPDGSRSVALVEPRRADREEAARGARLEEQAPAEPEDAYDADVRGAPARQQTTEPEAAEPEAAKPDAAPPPAAEAEAGDAAGQALAPLAGRQPGDRARAAAAGPRCFMPESEIRDALLSGPLGALVLAADGTLRSEAGGRPLVGFWSALPADSLRLRLTNGSGWLEVRLSRSGEGLSGISADGDPIGFRPADCPP